MSRLSIMLLRTFIFQAASSAEVSNTCDTMDGVHSQDCAPVLSQGAPSSSSLLQVGTRKEAQAARHDHDASDKSWLKISTFAASSGKDKLVDPAGGNLLPAQKGQARATLTDLLFNFGMLVFRNNEATLDAVVANTQYVNDSFAGELLQMRRVIGEPPDFAQGYDALGNVNFDSYGLVSLGGLKPNANGMLAMMDIGANEGAVSIAAFKKHPKKLRIVAAEPVPSTYFLAFWNMWLNGVPVFASPIDFEANPQTAGVLLVNKGVSQKDDQVLGLCYTPPATMSSYICDCALQGPATNQTGQLQCANVVSSSFGSLLGLFSEQELAFLKVDCEGCENDLLPALTAFTQQHPGWTVGRLAGELHAVSNQMEDIACNFEGGKWFSHVCNHGNMNISDAPVEERCKTVSATRKSCMVPCEFKSLPGNCLGPNGETLVK